MQTLFRLKITALFIVKSLSTKCDAKVLVLDEEF